MNLPGDEGIELEGVVGHLLVVEGTVLLLQEFPEVVNPDLEPQLGAEDVHPGGSPPVRDVLQSHVRLQYLVLNVEVDLLRLRVKVIVQEGQHESNGALLLHVRYEASRLVALLHAFI